MHDITTHGAANRTGFYTYLLAKGGSWKPKQNTEDPDRIEQNGRRASGKLSGAYRDSYGFEGVLIDANFDGGLDCITIDGTDYTPKELKRTLPLDLSSSSNGSGGTSGHGGRSGTISNPPSRGDGSSSGDWGGTPLSRRRELAGNSHGQSTVELATQGVVGQYNEFLEEMPFPVERDASLIVSNGVYNTGAVQGTILTWGGSPSIRVIGNPEDPYAVVMKGNHNFVDLAKAEHFMCRGMTWGRTQFAGCANPYMRDMVFTDRWGKEQSSIGGKPARGRFINCDIGHRNAPDEYAAYYYGGGAVHFDRGNTFRATGPAYIGVNNTVKLYIDGSNHWASGDKEIVENSGIRPSDLHGGMNIIDAGVRVA
ncbi:hypothetical protein [Halococcus hamelinensis]|uniref:Uncharacterized protein n=1 Tax=Halococcus hamelinensis 100A6 TaxID=1132509 RepID=M0LYD4_9EURY|nr:hypothetical protein [Halococcus hamelinensis]EMA38451.1 hypothetical protein C447_09862 [Halococcus hamelinensis 100A6]